MQYIKINKNTTLEDLSNAVGRDNVDTVLHMNGLTRVPNVGKQYMSIKKEIIENNPEVSVKSKLIALNNLTNDLDIFELVSMQGEDDWKVFNHTHAVPDSLRVPDGIALTEGTDVLGNSQQVPSKIYQDAINQLKSTGFISGEVFNEYNSGKSVSIRNSISTNSTVFEWFKLPWGQVLLYSSLSDSYVELPVYPEDISDSRSATYTTMPNILYSYEPWQIYNQSGPRENSYTFKFHRDMWTGDHGDGKANELIRFCQANCYPRYRGSSVITSTVTLYVAGEPLITGVLTSVDTNWSGPLGKRDNWYLYCEMVLRIIEVSQEPLNYDSVMQKPLIG